jgi:5-(carboxyamino)imidazole ribonucleotide synthase
MPDPYLPVLPGAWLGMLGGGQLGRMFCFAAQSMGYRVAILDPDPSSPASTVADRYHCAAYDDEKALFALAKLCAAVSIEFENIPIASLDTLARATLVRPAAQAVAIAQDRAAEKRFFAAAGVAVAPHLLIESADALATLTEAQCHAVLPGLLKTTRLGYDGKGQCSVANIAELQQAYTSLGQIPCLLEKRMVLADEISVIVARGFDGATVVYPPVYNTHHNGILMQTIAPKSDTQPAFAVAAEQATLTLAERLDYVGVLCVEYFILPDGTLLANEMAPRPHNSGHYTIDACATSQFEQQVRTMTGLPLGACRQHSTAIMLNLLGDLWVRDGRNCDPPWREMTALPSARLHLYANQQARPGRKMGHITFTAATLDETRQTARTAAQLLRLCMG